MRFIGAVFVVLLATLTVGPAARAADMDCSDFPSQQAAQLFFLNHNPAADPHRLDGDGDGVVCESQGPPFYFGSDPTPGGGTSTPSPSKPQLIKVVKVLEGDLLLLRQGTKPAYKVRLLGAEVRSNACLRNGARRYLRSWIKPGRVVWLDADRRAPQRDKQGHLLTDVITTRGNWTIPGSLVDEGWAVLPKYRFGERSLYERWAEHAEYMRRGHYATCVTNFGTERHPYHVGTSFELGPWRYQFAPTDEDALPEMQAENIASPGSVVYETHPRAGWVYVRVPVTVTRIGSGSGQVLAAHFGYRRGADEYNQFGQDSTGDWCGTGTQYLADQTLSMGQSLTGYVCATIPAPLVGHLDTWEVESQDLKTERLVAVS